jgi:hypothetical protein
MTPKVATASSTWHSTEGVPLEGCPARISVPGAATARPAFKLSSVNVAVVLGFMILMRIEGADHYTRTGSVPEARGPIPKGTSTPLSVMEDA